MFSFFNSKNPKDCLNFYQKNPPQKNDWSLLIINKNYIKNSPISRELDLYRNRDLIQFKLALPLPDFYQLLTINSSRIYEDQRPLDQNELPAAFNLYIDQLIQFNFSLFTTALNASKLVNPLNLENEEKSLEWIRVSFKVLTDAIISVDNDSNSSNTGQLFFGINPKTDLLEFRAIIYNLDISYVLLNDGNLRIKIYNDKNLGLGSSKTPVLQGDFSFRKREMFEQLILLIKSLRQTINI